jgi:hypothetical protein
MTAGSPHTEQAGSGDCSTVLAPVGDPDNPDFIIRTEDRIFRNESPVPGCDYVKGIDALIEQDSFEGSRIMVNMPDATVRQDQLHFSG